jgi:hypothetical protein
LGELLQRELGEDGRSPERQQNRQENEDERAFHYDLPGEMLF